MSERTCKPSASTATGRKRPSSPAAKSGDESDETVAPSVSERYGYFAGGKPIRTTTRRPTMRRR